MKSLLAILVLCSAGVACGGAPTPPAQSGENAPSDGMPNTWSGPPSAEESERTRIDEQQVQVVLARAAKNAHSCVEVAGKDQPHGEATVTVTFAGKGRSTKATIDPPFEGTPIGQCATRAFVDIIIPPFQGPDVDKEYKVNLKPDAPANAKKK